MYSPIKGKMQTQRNRMAGGTKRKTPKSDTCTVVTGKGVVCGKACTGPACGTHAKAYERENQEKLAVTGKEEVMPILDKMRTEEGKKLLDHAFLELLVTRQIFDPADNVNKFITGGVAEDVLAELIPKLGFPTENVAAKSTVIDIRVKMDDKEIGISLKNSGGIDQQPILENYRGETRAEIRPLPPTFIVYTETKKKRARIVYIDDDILRAAYPGLTDSEFNAAVYARKEEEESKQASLTFKSGLLKNLIPRLPKEYIVDAEYPEKIPDVKKKSITLLALEYVRSQMA